VKALSLTQPWASLVALGFKRVETRSWGTIYRGPLAIHAAKGFPRFARDFADAERVRGRCPDVLPFGSIVAVCRLVGVRPTAGLAEISELERRLGDYFSWPFRLVLGRCSSSDPNTDARPSGALGTPAP